TTARPPPYRTPPPPGAAFFLEIFAKGGPRPLPRILPGDGVGPDVRDRPDPHLLRDHLVPLHLRRDLGRAPRLGPGRLRAPCDEAPPRLLLRQIRRADPAPRG